MSRRARTTIMTFAALAAAALVAPAARAEHWTVGADLPVERSNAASATLPDGSVLAIGGLALEAPPGVASSVDRFDPATGTWTGVAPMGTARYGPVAVPLADGRVLVAGGLDGILAPIMSAEVYDPATGGWTPTDNDLGTARTDTGLEAGGTLLRDGGVLFAGSADSNAPASTAVDVYDPGTNRFAEVRPMHEARTLPSQTLLADGRVLVAGGYDGDTALAGAEVYDPVQDTWTEVGNAMSVGRGSSLLVTLPNGKALVGGGATSSGGTLVGTTAAELYDPATNRFAPTGTLDGAHIAGVVAPLPDGRVFVAGGATSMSAVPEPDAAEIYDPASGTWTATAPMPTPVMAPAAGVLRDGRVLIAGGYETFTPLEDTQLYTPSTPPGAPRAVTAVAGDGAATVRWSPPEYDGDNPILRYTITASTGQQVTTGDAGTAAGVGGLANGRPVTFTVAATTAFGTGPASAPSAAVTPAGPAAPPAARDTTAPTVRLGGLKRKLTRKALLRGLRLRITPSEPAALAVTLRGARRVKRPRYTVRLASRRFALGAARRLTLKPKRARVSPRKRFAVRLRVVATDAAGNRRAITRTIAVRPRR